MGDDDKNDPEGGKATSTPGPWWKPISRTATPPSNSGLSTWRRLLGAKVAVNRRGAADDLHEVRETPRAAERRDDVPSEQRPIHHP